MTEHAPQMFEPGDMGEFERVRVGTGAEGTPLYAWCQLKPPKYTGGFNADGTPTLAWQDAPPSIRAGRPLRGRHR